MANLFSYTKILSIRLQSSKQDLSGAMKNIKNVMNVFGNVRKSPGVTFDALFKSETKKTQTFEEGLKIPRLCGRQIQRNNTAVGEPKERFKISIFIPFLDHIIICELEIRFSDRFVKIIASEGLIPVYDNLYGINRILDAAKLCEQDISNSELELTAEINVWKNKWNNVETDVLQTAIEALAHRGDCFPNIKILMQIFSTIPVTTATSEQSFSTLRRQKNYLRSIMTEIRLNGLAVLNIHKNIPVDINKIVDTFSRKKN